MRPNHSYIAAIMSCLLACSGTASGKEDIEFVAEHLAEAAMDNRFAALPLWDADRNEDLWAYVAQVGYASTSTGNLSLAGPLFSIGVNHAFSTRWSAGAFAFFDSLHFSGDEDFRPLQTSFAPSIPIARPVDARFDNLDGRLRNVGLGLRVAIDGESSRFGPYRWTGGVLWQRVELRDDRLDYRVLAGPSIGTTGQIDFDSDYAHFTPFIGLEFPHAGARWAFTPHLLIASPYPKRGFTGHITGPGFDVRGNTADVGAGKHFGDPSLTIGADVTHLPWKFTIDIGSIVAQRYLEPTVHKGIDSNWLLTFRWSP